MAGQRGAGRRRIFFKEIFVERLGWFWWGFALRLHAMGARFTGFLRFSRQFEVKGERNTEHVAHRAQDAAEAGVFTQERDQVGVIEEMHQLRARSGDLVAGEEETKPAFALADYAPWRYRLGIWRCQCYGLLRFARNDGWGGAGFRRVGDEGGKAAGKID